MGKTGNRIAINELNHPEFIRIFARAGKLLREDKIHIGGTDKEPPKTQAEILYPNQGE